MNAYLEGHINGVSFLLLMIMALMLVWIIIRPFRDESGDDPTKWNGE